MKLTKNKKIILLLSGFGILTTSIVAPIILINKDEEDKENIKDLDKVSKIILKIKDKDILIPANLSTQNQSEIQNVIKNQLKKENQTLSEDDLSKITTNIKLLTLGSKIKITLTIKINSASKKLIIYVEKSNLLKNSNIKNGYYGTIFQDSFKNLWAIGKGTKLQVLKVHSDGNGYVNEGWSDNINQQELLRNSNIINDKSGTIFKDSFKNLWTMGYGKELKVLKANSNGTGYIKTSINDENTKELLKGSNIKESYYGTIFQDSFGNLWAMGEHDEPLQVLKVNSDGNGYVTTGWTSNKDAEGLLNGSNITNGLAGQIFQDSFKNLWTMGYGKSLQVLKANDAKDGYVERWTDVTTDKLLNNSNITNGRFGTIFQDSFKNLWAMGKGTKLQVLKANIGGDGYVTTGWINATNQGLLKGSNIINGSGGTIFQDSFKNLWAMGSGTQLQVLIANSDNTGYINSWLYEENKK